MPSTDTSESLGSRAMAGRRTVDRIRAFSRAGLSAQQVVGEQIRVIGKALATNVHPAFYVLDSADVPQHAFSVWFGTETLTDEIRMALATGIWPGPADVPSPQRLISDPKLDRVVAVQLWGHLTPPGPWEQLWRERGLQHGLYAAFFSPRGRIGILLASRANGEPPFQPADVAFVEACAPYVEASLDLPTPVSDGSFTPAEQAFFRFSADGRLAAMSFAGLSILRDLGGGGPGAREAGQAMVEAANRRQEGGAQLDETQKLSLILAGGESERAFRSSMFDLGLRSEADPDRTGASLILAENGFGRYRLRLVTLVALDGRFERIASVTRFVPPLLLRLRGAINVQATGREIQLLCALDGGDSLKNTADRLNIAKATARTLGERLAARVGASTLPQAVDRLSEIGRTALRTAV